MRTCPAGEQVPDVLVVEDVGVGGVLERAQVGGNAPPGRRVAPDDAAVWSSEPALFPTGSSSGW